MEHADLAQLAAVCGALGSALVLLARERLALVAGLVALGLAEAGLVGSLGDAGLDKLSSGTGAAAGLLGLILVGAAAALLARRPALVPIAVLVAAPFRPPLDFSASNQFFVSIAEDGRLGRLLPLYFVLAAAGLALAWRALRGAEVRALPRVLALPAATFFAFAFASLLWADDLEAGANMLTFFTLPFAALLGLVARAEFPDWSPRVLAACAILLGSLFAAVGVWQAITHELFFYAPNLAVSNANTDFFRVTSLFGDPSLYGRHLVLGIGAVLALLATGRARDRTLLAALALMWLGLFFSYSQSSMTALLIVTLAVAFATGDRLVRRAVGLLALGAALAALGFGAVKVIGGETVKQVTSDRTERVEDAWRVIEEQPIHGVGIGGQPRASRVLEGGDRPTANFVSHTTPLTVTAELGAIGLLLYLWLLAGGARTIAAGWRGEPALGLALGASLLALFVHALFYSGFLEDPLTWMVLAVAAGWVVRPVPAEIARAQRGRARAASQAGGGVAAPAR